MAKKREKKVIVSGVTREQMDEAFGKYAAADANIEKIMASMDAKITEIRNKNAAKLLSLEQEKAEAFDAIQAFATENRDEYFSEKKSMETPHGVLGFRTGTPQLKTRRGFTWASVLNLLKKANPEYIRTKEEVAKSDLLADREHEETRQLFEEIGVFVDQDETFFVECKKEEVLA